MARSPTRVHRASRERWLLAKRVVKDRTFPGSGLQPRPCPHIPAEAEIALEPELRLPRLFVGRVRISSKQCRRKLTDAMFQGAVKRCGGHARDIYNRPRFVGVRTDQQRDIILLSRSECLVG